ncbi:MAG: T9SS type A sorting domain-containing protein [Lewinellaceae bacterium]|nr:T9SS type A sorting domain-containing protein [Phaeodactylibacter sp.]MCB9035801.1 T9SS type A sorting domain-containing protein [Lewinellaceae bacterium]
MLRHLFLLLICLTLTLHGQGQASLCGDTTISTFSATYDPSGDSAGERPQGILRNRLGQVAILGLKRDAGTGAFSLFLTRLTMNGTLIGTPKQFYLDSTPGAYNFLSAHLAEVWDGAGNHDGYAAAANFANPAGANTFAIIRLDEEGCVAWAKEYDISGPATKIARDILFNRNGEIAVLYAIDNTQTGILEVSPDGQICNYGVYDNAAPQPPGNPAAFAELPANSPSGRYAVVGTRSNQPFLLLTEVDVTMNPVADLQVLPQSPSRSPARPTDIALAPDSSLVITGVRDLSRPPFLSDYRVFLMRFIPPGASTPPEGIVDWSKEMRYPGFPPDGNLTGSRLAIRPNGDIAVGMSGELTSIFPFQPLALAAGFNAAGTLQWVRRYSTASNNGATNHTRLAALDDGYLVAASRAPTASAGEQLWVGKTDILGQLYDCDCFDDFLPDTFNRNGNSTELNYLVVVDSSSAGCPLDSIAGGCFDLLDSMSYCGRYEPGLDLCGVQECRLDSFSLNTGVDHTSGMLINYGLPDPGWRFVSGPIPGLSSHPAFVVEPDPAWDLLYNNMSPVAQYISPFQYSDFGLNNPAPAAPYMFEKCFCVCDDSTAVTIEMDLYADDYAEVVLCDAFGSFIDTVMTTPGETMASPYDFEYPWASDTLEVKLNAGKYCIKVGLRNLGAVAMGFSAAGSVKGASVLGNLCCNNGSAITGAKFHDLNCDSLRNSPTDPSAPDFEPGLGGWGIVLCDSLGNPLDTAYTDTLGYYGFEFLPPGTYRVKELQQPGWEPTFPLMPDYWEVTLDTMEAVGFIDFGNKYTGPLAFRDSLECAKIGADNPITWEGGGGTCDSCLVDIWAVGCPGGPTINVASGIDNTGTHYWPIPPGFPPGDYRLLLISDCDLTDTLESACFPILNCCCDVGYEGFNYTQNCDSVMVVPFGLDSCYQVEWRWDNGLPWEGPYGPMAPVAHPYPGPGTYKACMRVTEFGDFGDTCSVNTICQLIPFDGCPSRCDSLILTAHPVDTANSQCCWRLDYANTYPGVVYGVTITPLGSASLGYNPATDIDPQLQRYAYSGGSYVTLVNNAFGPLPAGNLPDFFGFCLGGVTTSPQPVLIEWMDASLQNVLCDTTLLFGCEPEPEQCLYILQDSIACDSLGYKYIATVKNPAGSGFTIGRIKFNVLHPTGIDIEPDSIIDLSPGLAPGETAMVMFRIETAANLYGEDFCFLLSAHEGPLELLCCAEVEQCIPFPQCFPCDEISAMAMPADTALGADCCYSFTLKNGYQIPDYFTGFEVMILTPGVTLSGIDIPLPPAWWYNTITPGSHLSWEHFSGYLPIDTLDVFGFCLEGVTTTDSVYIQVNWMVEDSVACMDILAVFCPECAVITQDTVTCTPDGYAFSFNFINLNELLLPVNAVGIIGDSMKIISPEVGELVPLGDSVIYGEESIDPITVILEGPPAGNPGDTCCLQIILAYLNEDSVRVECCYIEHCFVLPDCSQLCPGLACSPPDDLETQCNELPSNFDPYDPAMMQNLFGKPEVLGCPTGIWTELPPIVGLDDCNFGTMTRRFEVSDGVGTVDTCQQQIYILEAHDYRVRFPADETIVCGQVPSGAVFIESSCDQLAVSMTTDTFATSGLSCYRIRRTYQVINWCEYDGFAPPVVIGRDEDCDGVFGDEGVALIVLPNGEVYFDRDADPFNLNPPVFTKFPSCDGLTNPDGHWISTAFDQNATPPRDISSVGHWEYTQFVDVIDTIAPQILFFAQDTFCSYDTATCAVDVQINFDIIENCIPDDVGWEIEMDLFITDGNGDGAVDGSDFVADPSGGLFTVTGVFPSFSLSAPAIPIGEHALRVIAADGCGNQDTAYFFFEVKDCAIDAPLCLASLGISLDPVVPPMDVDGDGTIDVAAATIDAEAFIQNTIYDCTGQGPNGEILDISINVNGEPVDRNQDMLTITCDDIGTLAVEIYVWDDAGNHDFCDAAIFVVDSQGFCGPAPPPASLLRLYPNPSNEVLFVETGMAGQCDVRIVNAVGVEVARMQYGKEEQQPYSLDISRLPAGVYFLRLSDSRGARAVRRFVKQ